MYNIAVEAFEVSCYMFPLGKEEISQEQRNKDLNGNIRSLVKFSGSAVHGGMIVTPSEKLLEAMAANMLGIDTPDENQKAGALSEMTNIICGNTVPLITDQDGISYIHPPQILKERKSELEKTQYKESVWIYLDEGKVEIAMYYSMEEEND